jgi:hypothetical protein
VQVELENSEITINEVSASIFETVLINQRKRLKILNVIL